MMSPFLSGSSRLTWSWAVGEALREPHGDRLRPSPKSPSVRVITTSAGGGRLEASRLHEQRR